MPDNALRLPEAIIASVHTPTPKTEGTATIGRPTARDLTLADLTSTAEALHDISGFTRAKSPDGKARWTNSILRLLGMGYVVIIEEDEPVFLTETAIFMDADNSFR